MTLNPQAKFLLDQMAAMGMPPIHEQEPEAVREANRLPPAVPGATMANVEDRNIPGPAGDIPVRIYPPPTPVTTPCWSGTTAAAGSSATSTGPT